MLALVLGGGSQTMEDLGWSRLGRGVGRHVVVGGDMANAGPSSLYPVVKPGDTIFLRLPSVFGSTWHGQGLQWPSLRGRDPWFQGVCCR